MAWPRLTSSLRGSLASLASRSLAHSLGRSGGRKDGRTCISAIMGGDGLGVAAGWPQGAILPKKWSMTDPAHVVI